MASISTVQIRRFKGLESIDVPLGDVTLLIGANNAGKSSVLQALHFAVSIAQTARLVGEGVAWRNDSFELSFNPSQLLYSPVADVLSLATGGTLLEPRPTQIEIELADSEGTRCTVGLRRGRNRNIAVSIIGRQIGEQLMDLQKPFTVYAPGLAGVPKEERYLSPGVVRRFVARGDANLVLRNVLRMLSENRDAWTDFIADMQSIFDGIHIEVDFDADTDEGIEAFFRFAGGPRLPIDAAGTSVLQASQILAYVALFKPRILILDEPDSHLHPDNQRILCDLVFRIASERNFQALISSHSRHVFDTMKNRCNIAWLHKGQRVEEPDLNATAVLLDLGALDSVDYFANGQTRCVVATEDSDQDALKAVLWSNGFVEDDTEVASYTGSSKIDAALVLGGFLASKAPHVRLVIHRDRDYLPDEFSREFEDKLIGVGIRPYITEFSDVEGCFLNAMHIHVLNPAISIERIQALIDQATAETSEKSISAIVNLRTEHAFRSRNLGGAAPNHGLIAVEAHQFFQQRPHIASRGKIVLRSLTHLLRTELGAAPRIFFPSPHLQSPALRLWANEIWGANAGPAAIQ